MCFVHLCVWQLICILSYFHRLLERSDSFVDHHVALSSLNILLNPKNVQGIFREEVCLDFQNEIERLNNKLSDWLTVSRARLVERVQYELNRLSTRSSSIDSAWQRSRTVHCKDRTTYTQIFKCGRIQNICSSPVVDSASARGEPSAQARGVPQKDPQYYQVRSIFIMFAWQCLPWRHNTNACINRKRITDISFPNHACIGMETAVAF